MSVQRDSFYDDDIAESSQRPVESRTPPVPPERKSSPNHVKSNETKEDPTVIPDIPSPSPKSLSSPSSLRASPIQKSTASQPKTIEEGIRTRQSSKSSSSESDSFESDEDEEEGKEEKEKRMYHNEILQNAKVHNETQTDQVTLRNASIQTETLNVELILEKPLITKKDVLSESKRFALPLVKNLLNQTMSSALPIISFCQPFSLTSHFDDVILAMPRHLMIINNQNSVSVYPWEQPLESSSTILECFWCSFLYKLLVTTLEDNSLHVYDFGSVIDSIKLRGQPLSIKHQSYYCSKQKNSSLLLPSSSRYQLTPAIWSQTRFTKSNSLGIYYCYISDRQCSCMLTRIDHNTRKHVKAIDCSGGSNNNNTRICTMGLSDERVAIVLTNLIMTLYDGETLLGLQQINLSRHSGYNLAGISSLMYLWKTWLILDPVENRIIGIGKRKRRFVKILPEQPVNACIMENGTLVLWLGYPGALFYYRSIE